MYLHACQFQVGVSHLQLSLRDGVRESSSRAYLHPISNRPNLHLTKYSMVKRIVIGQIWRCKFSATRSTEFFTISDPLSKQVKGIEMIKKGQTYFIKVKKEVISSAGAINSPQLLMLSGVGPKKHLQQLGKFNESTTYLK